MRLDDVVTVTDDRIVRAMGWPFEHLKIVAEPSGAIALAVCGPAFLPARPVSSSPAGQSTSVPSGC